MLELRWGPVPQDGMHPPRVVVKRDVFEYVLSGLLPRLVVPVVNQLSLQGFEEGLGPLS